MSITDNEAAIQRVRELCEAKTQEVAASDPLFGPPRALYVDDILRALDGWTLAPGTPYDHPATALDWCPNCTTIRSDLAVAMQRVRELHRHRMGSRYYVCAECGDNVPYPCATRRLVDDDPWAFLRALDGGTE